MNKKNIILKILVLFWINISFSSNQADLVALAVSCSALLTPASNQPYFNTQFSKSFKITEKTTLFIQIHDITKYINIDAIVNAANTSLKDGSGVCGAIFNAAGKSALESECNKIKPANVVKCDVGQACITGSCNLTKKNNIKHIIHAVGPKCNGCVDDKNFNLIGAAYENSLILANQNKLESIAFPFISVLAFNCPKPFSAGAGLTGIISYCQKNIDTGIKSIYFSLYSVIFDSSGKKFIEDIKTEREDFDLLINTMNSLGFK